MKDADLDFMADLLKRSSGLIVTKDKAYLIENRLAPIARMHGFAGLDGLIDALRRTPPAALVDDVVDAMTTNESFFFRDGKPFDVFRDRVLPDLAARRATNRALRIWCAAASTGQEPYTIAMLLKEKAAAYAGWKFQIVGTDISKRALDRAKSGIYSQFEVQRGLPIQMLVKYFEKNGDVWQIKPEIAAMVEYRLFNLLHDPRALGQFDVVFCRNVLIYFDLPTKERVLEAISRVLAPDGVLILGGAETVFGVSALFKPLDGVHGFYGRADAAKPAAAPARAAAPPPAAPAPLPKVALSPSAVPAAVGSRRP